MQKRFQTIFISSMTLVFALSATAEEEREVFSAAPAIKFQVSVDDATKTKLSAADSVKNTVKIVKVGQDYFWKTRENRKLIYSYSGVGDFHYFLEPMGGGYVKIARTPAGKITFLEHVGLGMVTITYFGPAQSFTP